MNTPKGVAIVEFHRRPEQKSAKVDIAFRVWVENVDKADMNMRQAANLAHMNLAEWIGRCLMEKDKSICGYTVRTAR